MREVLADADALTVTGRVLYAGMPYPGFEFTLQWFDGFDSKGQVISEHVVTNIRYF